MNSQLALLVCCMFTWKSHMLLKKRLPGCQDHWLSGTMPEKRAIDFNRINKILLKKKDEFSKIILITGPCHNISVDKLNHAAFGNHSAGPMF